MSIPKYYKSESFVLCPSDITNEFYNADVKKIKLIDDINDYYYTIEKLINNDFNVVMYDAADNKPIDSDIFSFDILDSLLLQWLNDDNYIIFDI